MRIALVGYGTRAVHQLSGRLDAHCIIRHHPLQTLVVCQRTSKGAPLLEVTNRVVERALRDANRLRPNRGATAIERVHRHGKSIANLTNAVRVGHTHVIETNHASG